MVSEDQSSNCTKILHNILQNNSQRSINGLLNPIFKNTVSRQLIDEGCIDNNDVECFFSQRVSYRYEMYHSRNYMRCRKTVDFLVRYFYNNSRYNFGEIDCFLSSTVSYMLLCMNWLQCIRFFSKCNFQTESRIRKFWPEFFEPLL